MFVFRTFGRFSLESAEDGAPLLANQRKALALLAVLAANGSAVSRDRLMALLWSESDASRARGSLKQLLHLTRRHLGHDHVIEGITELRLNSAVVKTDVAEFRSAIAAGNDPLANSLYAGPFLDGVFIDGAPEFERWSSIERQALAQEFAQSLERLARGAMESGRFHDAAMLWRRVQETDPTNGRLAVALMEALHASGDRAGAIRHARRHEALIREDLGASPEQRVVAYAEQLLQIADDTSHSRRSSGTAVDVSATATGVESDHAHVRAIESAAPEMFDRGDSVAFAEPANTSAHAVDAPLAKHRQRAGILMLGGVATLILLIATGWLYATRRAPFGATLRGASARNEAKPADTRILQSGRVAVAVLVNRTNEATLDAIGIMASDWLTRGLSHVPGVDAVEAGGLYLHGLTKVGEAVDPIEMARQNGAAIVVAGSYYQNANRDSLTFSTQVIDVATGRVERALDPVSADKNQPIAALDELRQRVTTALGTLLDPRIPILNTPLLIPPRLDAYTEFLAGQEIYWQGDWEGSLPFFRRAAARDSMFFTAAAFVSIAAVGTGRCVVVDSIAREFATRRDRIPELDMLTVQSSQARCASDMAEHHRLQRRRIELMPGSKFLQLWLATTLRVRNLPAEALVTMENINPDRDLGWLNERGRSFYWREIAAAQHMLGDYVAERATADRMQRAGGTPLAFAYFTARIMAETHKPDSALQQLQGIKAAANDPALLSGLMNGRLNAVHLASPGWVMFETALELSRSGDDSAATTAADMAIAWFHEKGAVATLPAEQQWVLAQCLVLVSRLDDAHAIAAALVKAHPDFAEFRGLAGIVAAHRNDRAGVAAAERWLDMSRGIIPVGAPVLYRAEIAAVLGDTAAAMLLIESLPHNVHPCDFIQFHIDPEFRNLRVMPRFQRLLVPKG